MSIHETHAQSPEELSKALYEMEKDMKEYPDDEGLEDVL